MKEFEAEASNFTKSNTSPRVFFKFFKLYEWYKIAQSITFLVKFQDPCLQLYYNGLLLVYF